MIQTLESRVLMWAGAQMHPTLQALDLPGSLTPQNYSSPPAVAISPSAMQSYYGIDAIQFGSSSIGKMPTWG